MALGAKGEMKQKMILGLGAVMALALQALAVGESIVKTPPKLDPIRREKASVILEARLVGFHGGSKYHWQTVEPIRTLKNTTKQTFDKPFRVANYGWDPSVPKGASIIYLVPYGGRTDLWRILPPRTERDRSKETSGGDGQ